jgi:ADP-heptose:LPS heptosyltransferase
MNRYSKPENTGGPILIVPYMWIGDFVRCHSVVKLLNARFPDRPVDILSTTLCAPLTNYMPGLRRSIVFDLPRSRLALTHQLALARCLRRENYGAALIMPRTWKSVLAPFLAGIPERTGFVGEARYFLLNDLRHGERRLPRMVDRCAALALPAAAKLPRDWPMPELKVAHAEIDTWRRERGFAGDGRPAVALAPGAVGPSKRWPASAYAALTRRLIAEGLNVWVIGGPEEKALAGEIIAGTTAHDLTGLWPYQTIPDFCMSPPHSEPRPSESSARPALGIGRRSIRWRQRSRRPANLIASHVTSRSAASFITAACAISPQNKSSRPFARSSPRLFRPPESETRADHVFEALL